MIGPLYLRIHDLEGAVEHYRWFEKTFTDDAGEPFHRMGWTLTLYKNGLVDEAEQMLLRTMLRNLYLFPVLFGEEPKHLGVRMGSNWEEMGYVMEADEWYFDLWNAQELEWAIKVHDSPLARKIRDRYITIHEFLEIEPVGEKRSMLVEEASRLRRGDYSSLLNIN